MHTQPCVLYCGISEQEECGLKLRDFEDFILHECFQKLQIPSLRQTKHRPGFFWSLVGQNQDGHVATSENSAKGTMKQEPTSFCNVFPFFWLTKVFLRQLFAGSNTSQSVLCYVFTMAGLSTQEFLNCPHSPVRNWQSWSPNHGSWLIQVPVSSVFCLVTILLAKYQIRGQVSFRDHVVHEKPSWKNTRSPNSADECPHGTFLL